MDQKETKTTITPSPSPSPWSDLPPELLNQIGQRLQDSPIDVLRFRAVCPSWRSSLSLPFRSLLSPNFPIKIPPYPFLAQPQMTLFSLVGGACFYLTATTSFFLCPIEKNTFGNACSLISVDELNPGKLGFVEPLSRLYQSTWAKKSIPILLDLLRFRLSVVGEHFIVRHLSVRQNAAENFGAGKVLEPSSFDKELSAKAVLLWEFSIALVVFEDGKLAVIGLMKDKCWKMVHDGTAFQYDDIVKGCCDDVVYGVDRFAGAYLIRFNPKSGSIDQVPIALPIIGLYRKRKRIVLDSSSERLLMVENAVVNSKLAFSVYKLELGWQNLGRGPQNWEKIINLGDQIIFVGYHFSVCASVQKFNELAKITYSWRPSNCIFFAKGSFPRYNGFDFDEKNFFEGAGTHLNIGMFRLEDDHAVGLLEPGYDSLLLPPINWFLPQPSSLEFAPSLY